MKWLCKFHKYRGREGGREREKRVGEERGRGERGRGKREGGGKEGGGRGERERESPGSAIIFLQVLYGKLQEIKKNKVTECSYLLSEQIFNLV